MQVEDFDSAKDKMRTALQAQLDKLSRYQQLLFQCQSCKHIEIRKREAEKLARDIMAQIDEDCTQLSLSAATSCERITVSNRKCVSGGRSERHQSAISAKRYLSISALAVPASHRDLRPRFEASTLHSFEEDGAFAPENIAAYKQKIKEIDEHVDKVQAKECEMSDALRALLSTACDKALESVVSQLVPHRQDVALLETLTRCMLDARRCGSCSAQQAATRLAACSDS